MTIGKIYCARLIYENYKYLKKKRGELQVSAFLFLYILVSVGEIFCQIGYTLKNGKLLHKLFYITNLGFFYHFIVVPLFDLHYVKVIKIFGVA